MTVTYDRDGAILREIHLMTSNGWVLRERRSDGADFATVPRGSGVSTGAHLVLIVLTFGLWIPFAVIVEVAAMNRTRFCRLTFDSQGRAQYERIKRPRR